MILLSSRFLKREKSKYRVYPILKHIEDGEFPLLIKEQRDYHGRFRVCFRMSVAQFDALLAILEPHIKKMTTNFCELSVQGSLYSAARWSGLIWQSHSGFWHSLIRWLLTVKIPLKMLSTDVKNERNWTQSNFFYEGHKFQRQYVNVIDITWGRI